MIPADKYIQDTNCPFKGAGLFFVNDTEFTFFFVEVCNWL